jgi:hypothetical protein
LVSTLVTLTATPGTTAPDGSTTRPTTLAVGVCAFRQIVTTQVTLARRQSFTAKPPESMGANCRDYINSLTERLPHVQEGISIGPIVMRNQ